MAAIPPNKSNPPPEPNDDKKESNHIPETVQKAVFESFKRLSQQPALSIGHSSAFRKKSPQVNDYHFGGSEPLSLLEIIDASPSSLQILDIGCGDGSVAANLMKHSEKAVIFGVDAREPKFLPKEYFIRGNAEKLASIESLADKTFDLIVSQGTFRFFIDPKEALIEAYEKLNEGGFLLIDQIVFPGLDERILLLASHLQGQGYRVYVESTGPGPKLNYFAIQKMQDSLQLPIAYDPDKPLSHSSAQYIFAELNQDNQDLESRSLREFFKIHHG